ncbi:hypothetical protein BASA81_010136 [Batrachochytrium salamandrivorans]|nr:hypothetical protein BASA81_010136 [Batrachochytrium salamandrivorans]
MFNIERSGILTPHKLEMKLHSLVVGLAVGLACITLATSSLFLIYFDIPPPSLELKPIGSKPERFLMYDLYRGRFGNQIVQMEWAYRLAFATNRTLVMVKPFKEYQFVGMPFLNSQDSEYSIWDVDLLDKGPVRIHFHQQFNWTGPAPTEQCTWTEKDGKFVVTWAMAHTDLPECHQVLRIRSRKGLITPHRTDTREFGVDPLLFWKHVQFNPKVFAWANKLLKDMLPSRDGSLQRLGLHARTFRETGTTQTRVLEQVCGPKLMRIPMEISRDLRQRERCGCAVAEAVNPQTGENWLEVGLERHWKEIHMLGTCDVSIVANLTKLMHRSVVDLQRHGFFAATDHNAHGFMDKVLVEMGGRMINFTTALPIPGMEQAVEIDFALKNQNLVLDLAMLILVDEFVGVPVSSLSSSVCLWRRAMDRPSSDMCEVLYLATHSPRCTEHGCDETARCCK